MIFFNYETDFKLKDETIIQNWISECIESYGFTEGEINSNEIEILVLKQKLVLKADFPADWKKIFTKFNWKLK